MRVELRDEAREDLVDSAAFYAEQSAGLDDHFLECIRTDLNRLEATAGVHEVYRGFHRSLCKRFPFAIYYLMADGLVDVVAILDCRQNPDFTVSRLGRNRVRAAIADRPPHTT